MKLNRSSTADGRAFTLVELTVVILLVAILSAMIIPAMRGTFQDALLRSSSRELINSLGIAYSRAVSLNQLHRFRFDTGSGRYLVERHEPGAAPDEFSPLKDIPGCEGKLDRRISVQIHKQGEEPSDPSAAPAPANSGADQRGGGSDDAISFYPDGTADGAEVELRDPDGFRLGLRINPTTARVQIIELKRE